MLRIWQCAILVVAFFVCSNTASIAKSSDPDWPGEGNINDWTAGCALNDQANKAMEDEYVPGSTTINRSAVNKAISLYKQAIAKYPYETAFYDGLAKCYSDLGDDKQAEANYRKSVEVKEKYRGPYNKIRYGDTYLALARLCVQHHEPVDADRYYKKACEYYATLATFKEYASFLKGQKRLEEAAAVLKKEQEMEKQYEKNRKNTGGWYPTPK
jgi:tetratricopeptide (TPR) repeat protein